jgi:hypothetical protein
MTGELIQFENIDSFWKFFVDEVNLMKGKIDEATDIGQIRAIKVTLSSLINNATEATTILPL